MIAMTGFSAYFNDNTVYINGKKKYILGEILEKILDKRYRELDKTYSECKRYEAILHYPEDICEFIYHKAKLQGSKDVNVTKKNKTNTPDNTRNDFTTLDGYNYNNYISYSNYF